MKTLVLDPGHGGSDPGAVNRALGMEEADYTLRVCLLIEEYLAPCKDLRVVLTRSSDRFLSLSNRSQIANTQKADAFVSYHFNSASNPNVPLSFEGFTTPGQTNADALAEKILKHHARLCPEQEPRKDMSDGDADKEANFAVLRRTKAPAFLMEGEFIHTPHGGRWIKDPANQKKMALAVVCGVLEYFNLRLPDTEEPAPLPKDQSPEIKRLADQIKRLANDLSTLTQ